MSTPESLYASLAWSPDDWQVRSVLADWFEESGRQAVADAIRWMIRRRKRPYCLTSDGTWHWFNGARQAAPADDPQSDLPGPIYQALTAAEGLADVFRDYASLRAADEDFYRGWAQARQKGWSDDA